MKTKILLLSAVFVLATAFAAESTEPAQTISLNDGTKITFLGITYGRHHVAPNYEAIGGHIQSGNWIDRTNDVTVAWFEVEHDPSQWPSFSLLVSDNAKTACVMSETSTRCHVKNGVEVHGFVLRAFPRWDKEFILQIGSPYGRELSPQKIIVANPQPVSLGNQPAESLPQTKSDGNFAVTLTKLVAAAPYPPYQRAKGTATDDLRSKCVRLAFDFRQNGRSVTNWYAQWVETSDAAGNHVGGNMQYQDNEFMSQHLMIPASRPVYSAEDNYKGYYFRPGLWPNEPAWTVRIEFTRGTGFDEDEILTLTNLPAREGTREDYDKEWSWEPGQSDPPIGDYTVNGIKLKLFPALILPDPDHAGQKNLHVIMHANPFPQEFRMTFLDATDNQGKKIVSEFTTAGGNCTFEFLGVGDVKTFDLKFALHKSRFVTFAVKPDRW